MPRHPQPHASARSWSGGEQIRGGKLERATCDAAECRLVVTGTEAEVTRAIEDLEGPRGFHGLARNVHLTSPTLADDGTVTLHVHVRF